MIEILFTLLIIIELIALAIATMILKMSMARLKQIRNSIK